eukprot:1108162-Pyramimonas_sp.AAC.1
MGAGALETFVRAAKRTSQRSLSSEAARCPDRVRVDVDVEGALLQGAMHAEMQEQGEAPRGANFTQPPGNAAIFRQALVFESFDERTECLRCVKPRAGCNA